MKVISLFGRQSQAQQFEQLLRPHMTRLYQAAYRLTLNQDAAEDLVQDLLAKLYPRTAELAAIESLWPWLKKALYREFVDGLRKQQRRPEPEADAESVLEQLESAADGPEQQLDQHRTAARLEHALEQLDTEQRTLIVMYLMEGYSLQELSELFGRPAETIKTRIRRARTRLKKILSI